MASQPCTKFLTGLEPAGRGERERNCTADDKTKVPVPFYSIHESLSEIEIPVPAQFFFHSWFVKCLRYPSQVFCLYRVVLLVQILSYGREVR